MSCSTKLRLVAASNRAWSIQDIVFENVNIKVIGNASKENEDETAIKGNLFFNGGRGSIIAEHGEKLYIGTFILCK